MESIVEGRRVTGAQPATASDEECVRRARCGERGAFESLVRRHQRALVGYLSRQLGHPEAARDVAQEVFLKVYLALGTFDPRYRFKTWMYRVAANCAIDHLRRRPRVTCPFPAGPAEGGIAPRLDRAGPSSAPDEILQARETHKRLEAAIRRLPTDLRQLILLRYRQHCRYEEIARITDLPLGTVKNRIFRAREALRAELADILGGTP